MVDMFGRVRPETNLEKIKAMVCTSGFVWSQIGKMAYKQRATGEGGHLWERKQTRVSCSECRLSVEASLLRHHMERSHGVIP